MIQDYDGDAPPTCDICGRTMWDSPNVFDYGETTEVDWNGETGNHKYCEERDNNDTYDSNWHPVLGPGPR